MTVDEILDAMPDEDAATGRDYLVIDPVARTITVPASEKTFGVTGDDIADRKYFICPRYVGDNLDLAGMFIRVNYRNAGGDEDGYLVDDVAVSGNYVTFSWKLWPKVTEYKGAIQFGVCADLPNTTDRRYPDWNTTMASGEVLEGLHPYDGDVEEETRDVVTQLRDMVTAQTGSVEATGATQVQAVQTAATAATADAQAQIEAKGAATLATIPADYTTMANKTNEQANAIKGHLSGEIVQAGDVSPVEHYLGVRVHGKNLIPFPYHNSDIVRQGVEITVAEDGTFTLNGTALADSAFRLVQDKAIHVKGKYTLSGFVGGATSTFYLQPFIDGKGVSALLSGAKTYEWDGVLTSLVFFFKAGTVFDNMQVKPQLEYGTVATEYTPYIDPAGVTVARCGKNLLDMAASFSTGNGLVPSENEDGSFNLSGTLAGTFWYCTAVATFIPKGTTVAASSRFNTTHDIRVGLWVKNAAGDMLFQTNNAANGYSASKTLTDDAATVGIVWVADNLAGESVEVSDIKLQLELGDTATEYEPYNGTTAMPAADGTVGGLTSLAPTMTLLTDTAGVTIDCTYNRDSNAVYAELLAKIAALGGTI